MLCEKKMAVSRWAAQWLILIGVQSCLEQMSLQKALLRYKRKLAGGPTGFSPSHHAVKIWFSEIDLKTRILNIIKWDLTILPPCVQIPPKKGLLVSSLELYDAIEVNFIKLEIDKSIIDKNYYQLCKNSLV